jgi:hypothetical protein
MSRAVDRQRFQNPEADFDKIHPVVTYNIKNGTCPDVSHNKFLLISSICATCFGSTDQSQPFKYTILKFKIKRAYILNILNLK